MITSSISNAYGAYIQMLADQSGNGIFCVFLSWMDQLAAGKIRVMDSCTFEEHILAAALKVTGSAPMVRKKKHTDETQTLNETQSKDLERTNHHTNTTKPLVLEDTKYALIAEDSDMKLRYEWEKRCCTCYLERVIRAPPLALLSETIVDVDSKLSEVRVLASGLSTSAMLGMLLEYPEHLLFNEPGHRSVEKCIFRGQNTLGPINTTLKHWVLGWADFGDKRATVFDSVLEVNSIQWARPLLMDTISKISVFVYGHPVDWKGWRHKIIVLPLMKRQVNGWSCGLFVMMAMKGFNAHESVYQNIYTLNQYQAVTRSKVLRALLDLLVIRKVSDEQYAEDKSSVKEIDLSLQPKVDQSNMATVPDGASDMMSMAHEALEQSSSSLKWPLSEVDDVKTIIPKNVKHSEAAKGPCKSRQTLAQQKDHLEEDIWIKQVKDYHVKCKGYDQWIKLQSDRMYNAANWLMHRVKCSQNTEVKRARVKLLRQKLDAVKVEQDKSVEEMPISARRKYEYRDTFITPSVALVFGHAKADMGRERVIGKQMPEKMPYTYTLGSISLTFCAQVICQLFPYKPFGAIKLSKDKHALEAIPNVPEDAAVPENGNTHIMAQRWTPLICLYVALVTENAFLGYLRRFPRYVRE
ncbi:hypothetical protein OE88DRAFT_1642520 [Heliocybe sulcata]|uniref:Ubiquitin-like protease family profile domain-containing protein n=1 Tax=Heliocybe sulcata TaxID=5364 RepID=A0A5C3NCD2_9AGAM|nr:hypothetical protein OE88DRAFT_1642520 [Heliocybe sulcata]